MGHLSRDSYFSRGIPPICARNRSFSSAELCHNQTAQLPGRTSKSGGRIGTTGDNPNRREGVYRFAALVVVVHLIFAMPCSLVRDGINSTTSPSMWSTSPGRTGNNQRRSSTPSPISGCGPNGRNLTARPIEMAAVCQPDPASPLNAVFSAALHPNGTAADRIRPQTA